MPAKKSRVQDLYANRAFESITMSGANTLTFSQVQFGVGLFQGVAAIIHRIEWSLPLASMIEMITITDELMLALTNRDDLSSILPISQNVLAFKSLQVINHGTAASGEIIDGPFISDFTDLGGGGLIVPANPLYIGMDSAGWAAAGVVNAVIYLTFKELADAEYVELIQTIMPANL